ncbi:MAG TPA: lysophospholipid acyltransferase family protein [Bryobacteraceae bacterium]|nr:lysophospholipid acyltransferase family protein [Bryobacteraceae bacterium]
MLASLAKWASRPQVRWIGAPAGSQPRVYFANHSSHLDFVVLWAALPKPVRARTRPVVAREYWESTFLRAYLAKRVFHSVLITRNEIAPLAARSTISALLRELDRGGSIVLFPEGTRGDGREVARFKRGLYELCRQRPDIEAVPVYLENLSRILPKGEILPTPSASRVTFGPPMRIRGGEGDGEFLSRARQALLDLKRR